MFSDDPNITNSKCDSNICDMMKLHDETQEEWEQRLKIILDELKERFEISEKHIETIYTMLAVGKEDMGGIRNSMKRIRKQLGGLAEADAEKISKLTEILVRLDYKKEGDKKRNGKQEKLESEEKDL